MLAYRALVRPSTRRVWDSGADPVHRARTGPAWTGVREFLSSNSCSVGRIPRESA